MNTIDPTSLDGAVSLLSDVANLRFRVTEAEGLVDEMIAGRANRIAELDAKVEARSEKVADLGARLAAAEEAASAIPAELLAAAEEALAAKFARWPNRATLAAQQS